MDSSGVRVLLVDDDEEEFVLVRKFLKQARTGAFQVEWAATFEAALDAMKDDGHDVCLLDHHLGARTGLELLGEMRAQGHSVPAILLTGQGSLELDLEAMEMGAFDYLEKAELTPGILERSIRYTIENHRARDALRLANEELEQRVQERTADLNRSNQALEQFANVVAHDLQAPAEAVGRLIAQMKDRQEERGESKAEDLTAALHAANNMGLLVRSVLDYSLAQGEAKSFESVDLAEIVQEVWADLAGMAAQAGATIEVESLPTVDRHFMIGLFENLLDNAIRYRGPDPPKIRVLSEKKGDHWPCTVSDNGIGIETDEVEDIFLMFHRGNHEADHEGVGIGLAICRKIVQYHAGKIWVDSEPGRGSTFCFSILSG